jgi:hypothetical protein
MLQLNQWVVSVPIIWIWLALPSGNASKPSRLQIRPPRWPLSQLAKPTTQQLYVTIHNLKVRGGGAPQSNSGSFVGGRISLDNSVPPPCNDNHSTIIANAEGETNVYNSDYAPTAPINYDNVPDQQEQQQEDEPDPFHETVQERVDQWRTNLQQHSAELQASPRDEQGRSKLLVSVSRGSRVFIFVLLMLRDLHLYETASQVIQPAFLQGLVSSFLVIMFIANMTGVVACLASPTHATKKRLKAILNIEKLVEIVMMMYAVLRLTVFPSQYIPKEVYVGNLMNAAFFLFQCQMHTKLSWDEKVAQPIHTFQQQQQQQVRQQPRPSYEESPFSQQQGPGYVQY